MREIGNGILHFVVGGLFALAVCYHAAFMIPATFVYAFLREQAQHRLKLSQETAVLDSQDPGWLQFHDVYRVEKRSFFDFSWLTWHSMFEVLQWTAGAIAAFVLSIFL